MLTIPLDIQENLHHEVEFGIMAEEDLTSIRTAVTDKKAVVGTKSTLRALRQNKAATVYLTANAPDDVRETIYYYSKQNNVPCVELTQDNEELGLVCRKPFLISVMALTK